MITLITNENDKVNGNITDVKINNNSEFVNDMIMIMIRTNTRNDYHNDSDY